MLAIQVGKIRADDYVNGANQIKRLISLLGHERVSRFQIDFIPENQGEPSGMTYHVFRACRTHGRAGILDNVNSQCFFLDRLKQKKRSNVYTDFLTSDSELVKMRDALRPEDNPGKSSWGEGNINIPLRNLPIPLMQSLALPVPLMRLASVSTSILAEISSILLDSSIPVRGLCTKVKNKPSRYYCLISESSRFKLVNQGGNFFLGIQLGAVPLAVYLGWKLIRFYQTGNVN